MEEILHMNGGVGETSYATNSLLQRTVISMVKPILEESILELYGTLLPECLNVADLGCSTGPNTLLVISEILESIEAASQKSNLKLPLFQVFLNDLPGNDFNTVFRSLPGFCKKLEEERGSKLEPCFIAGVPGSFYGRLFHNKSLHFVHSSYALMWLSEPPKALVIKPEALNKGNICIAKTSTPAVFKAYYEQFNRDFSMFLKSRGEEVVPGGRMMLTTMGNLRSDDPLTIWEFVGLKLNDMVLEGLIEEKSLDSFNLSYYAPTAEEVKKVIEDEGSFTLERLETFMVDWDTYISKADCSLDTEERAAILATDMRAVGEPILSSQFGESIMDDLFMRFKRDVFGYMEAHECKFINLVISLTRKT
ncbi:salicylate carboxymethyltransferase-like [Pistacia vera]|uniref:salicylate carboxymethyltransferase-like n=1 Tax=Pistacia vera TaxID=55513 RepID=UPI00126356E1|nr:salicylate carboxymethyltransferase-like [Pistacia vera]